MGKHMLGDVAALLQVSGGQQISSSPYVAAAKIQSQLFEQMLYIKI
jgi:hypothetical protein